MEMFSWKLHVGPALLPGSLTGQLISWIRAEAQIAAGHIRPAGEDRDGLQLVGHGMRAQSGQKTAANLGLWDNSLKILFAPLWQKLILGECLADLRGGLGQGG